MIEKIDNHCARAVPARFASDRLLEGASWAMSQVAGGLRAAFGDRQQTGFGILMYHRVTDHEPGLATPTCNVTPQRLRKQLSGLLKRGFVPWPLERLISAQTAGERIPPRAFAVTFDDGYENNLLNALPILREFGIPATIFLATGFLGSQEPFPSDTWSLAGKARVPVSSWRLLSIEQCHALQASGLVGLGRILTPISCLKTKLSCFARTWQGRSKSSARSSAWTSRRSRSRSDLSSRN